MINFILGMSLTLNFICGLIVYIVIKKKKVLKGDFCSDTELNDMLSKL